MGRHYAEEFGLTPQAERLARNAFRLKDGPPLAVPV
jgi:hypothetical protein